MCLQILTVPALNEAETVWQIPSLKLTALTQDTSFQTEICLQVYKFDYMFKISPISQ